MLIPRNDQTSDLLPPLPEWRRELRERVEAYRASHPRPVLSRPAGNTPEATEPQQATDERVLPFRQQPTLLVMTASESAEPIADPVVFAPPVPAPAPEPAEAQLELASEPTWDDGARRDYLQLPLPMSTAAHPSGGRLPADMAPPRLRMQAGIIDAAVVITAAVLFTLAGWASQNFPSFSSAQLHALLPALVAVPAGLAALYLLLCAYAGGATIGMRYHGLALRAWDGPLTAAARRRRGWASVISLAALGMGFLWMVCDRQHLSWHDAISRTCVVRALDES